MPSLSTHSSKASVSWPGHPMAAGSYMLQAAQEPILVTHTNFTAAAPPSRSCSANSAQSRTSDNTHTTGHYRCILAVAVLCSLLSLALLIAGLVFLLDGLQETSRTVGIILTVAAALVTVGTLVIWRYTCQHRKHLKETQQAVSLKSVKSTDRSTYARQEIYL